MKIIKSILVLLVGFLITSCEKEYINYPKGYDHIYYVFFDYIVDVSGNVNSRNIAIDVPRNSTELTPLSVKFMSSYTREYDVEVRLYVKQNSGFLNNVGLATAPPLAVAGIDFLLQDAEGKVLTPVKDGDLTYFIIPFKQAIKDIKTVYVKMLNNQDDSSEKVVWFSYAYQPIKESTEEEYMNTALNNKQEKYSVLTKTNSQWRRINIK